MKSKFFGHLALVTRHRFEVFKNCAKCGLIWRGLVHDLSKFSPTEFFESAKFYCGTHSPIVECRKSKGYSLAWIHHKNRNKHHPEYWYDTESKTQIVMPYKYVVECVCDKIAATKCYYKKNYNARQVLEHWQKWGNNVPINEKTEAFINKVFEDLVERGEKYILNKKYMKTTFAQICGQNPK